MIGIVVVSHGALADELLRATEHVVGPLDQAAAVAIGPEDDPAVRREDISRAVAEADSGDGVVVLTDMFGGTPSNLAISIMEGAAVEVIAGVNLPMLLSVWNLRDRPLGAGARKAVDAGRRGIRIVQK